LLLSREFRLDIDYDHLVIAVGTAPNTFGIPGVQEHAMFLKELPHGVKVRQEILQRLEQATLAHVADRDEDVRRLLSVAIVGGGPTGVEFAAEMADWIRSDLKISFPNVADRLKITLIEALPAILPMFEKPISDNVKQHLASLGVEVRTETMVKGVDNESITLERNRLWTTVCLCGLLGWVRAP
jgi:NADH:ubiquinone reductase (non-electrogenic)